MKFRSLATLAGVSVLFVFSALSANAAQVQVSGIDQLFACGSGGCGGIFDGTVNGTAVQLMCIDFQNDVYIPSVTYNANISTVTTGSSTVDTRFGGSPDPASNPWQFTTDAFHYGPSQTLVLSGNESSALARYQMVTWLASNYDTPGVDNNAIQSAIWQITSTTPLSVQNPVTIVAGSSQWLSKAASWYVSTGDGTSASAQALLSHYQVVTNVNPAIAGPYPTQIQEFLMVGVAPEPKYVVILLPVMLMVWLWRRRVSQSRA